MEASRFFLKAILNDYVGSRIILVDPHGEYSSVFPDAKIFKINDKSNPLYIPFWLMNFDELAFFLVGVKPNDDQKIEHRCNRPRKVQNFRPRKCRIFGN